jgi:MoaA/NifB/PqqE/SkfB family radical SAM enzyme
MIIKKEWVDQGMNLYGRLVKNSFWPSPSQRLYYIYINNKCNLKCDYCWQRLPLLEGDCGIEIKDELNFHQWIKVIDSLPRLSAVGFSGGEPLLTKNFLDIFSHTAKKHPVTINSNGLLLDKNNLDLFVKYKLKNLSLSLDGFSQIHDKNRRHPGLFDKIVSNIKFLNQIKKKYKRKIPKLTIKTTLVDECLDDFNQFVNFCEQELMANTLNVSLMKTSYHAQFSCKLYEDYTDLLTAGLPKSEHYKSVDKVTKTLSPWIKRKSGIRGKMGIIFYPRLNRVNDLKDYFENDGIDIYGNCYLPWSLVTIMSSGNVIPCFSFNLGNLCDYNYNIQTLLKDNKRLTIVRNMLKKYHKKRKTQPVCNCCCFLRVCKVRKKIKK